MNQYYIVKDKPSKNPEGRWLSGPETKWVEPIDVLKIPEVEAAEKLCELYFNIASKAIGEDEVRRQRDEALPRRQT